MALFTVQRYAGDDSGNVEDEKKAELLKRLHQAVEKRKQERRSRDKSGEDIAARGTGAGSAHVQLTQGDDDKEESHTPRKKKKRKSEAAPVGEEPKSSGEHDGAPVTASPRKQLKRDRGRDSEDNDVKDGEVKDDEVRDREVKDAEVNDDEEVKDVEEVEGDEVMENGSEGGDAQDPDETPDGASGQSHKLIGGFTVIGSVKERKLEKVRRVLPKWLADPSVISADLHKNRAPFSDIKGMDGRLIQRLKQNNITDLFPVQRQVIPVLLESGSFMVGRGGYRPCDICCSAPTGSGKTLAYVLPIVQLLKDRVVPHVRALVVLPVRDLASQVFKVFQTYCKDYDLKVALLSGRKPFAIEQQSLVRKGMRGCHSLVDIVVTTPGRLVDHINKTEGLDLRHLRYLVVDEADRMMDEVKHEWLMHVENAVYGAQEDNAVPESSPAAGSSPDPGLRLGDVVIHGGVSLAGSDCDVTPAPARTRSRPGPLIAKSARSLETPLQKLLFSATLSQNPEKLQQLNLFQPKLFTSVLVESTPASRRKEEAGEPRQASDGAQQKASGEFIGKFTTPGGLTEFFVRSSVSEKPLYMLYLLQRLQFKGILCFTNSVESTHRLYWLLKLVGGIEVREFSSNLQGVRRDKLLKQFTAGKIDILICSDVLARGMDVDNVRYVISYDLPKYLKTYVHRVGRTARAGRVGTAVTLLETKDIGYFKGMLREAGKTGVKALRVKSADLKPFVKPLQTALAQLAGVLKDENR